MIKDCLSKCVTGQNNLNFFTEEYNFEVCDISNDELFTVQCKNILGPGKDAQWG